MDDIIERAYRGDATALELQELASWRAAHADHEHQYLAVVRILETAHALQLPLSARESNAPAAAEVIARGRAAEAASAAAARARALSRVVRARRWLPWGVAAAASALLAIQLVHSRSAIEGNSVAEVVTGPRELATVKLADGSVVRLAPASRLALAEGGDVRRVALTGRAFFAVAKRDGHPFWVHTAAANARVLGTRFEVATGANDMHLVVLEGRVALEAPGNTVEVAAGEATTVANGQAGAPERLAHADDALRWVGKFLAFQATPLSDVAAELETTYGVRVVITDSALARQTVTASFTEQSLDTVLGVLCPIVDARCVARGNVITIARR